MADTLNNQDEKTKSHHHHHHHHHSSSTSDAKDGTTSSHHHHHHHHHSVKAVTGSKLRRLPWLTGIGLVLVCLAVFFALVMCTKFV